MLGDHGITCPELTGRAYARGGITSFNIPGSAGAGGAGASTGNHTERLRNEGVSEGKTP